MYTNSLFLIPAEKELEDRIRPQKKAVSGQLRSKDGNDSFTADVV